MMKKVILSLAVLFASSVTAISYAQTQSPANANSECCTANGGQTEKVTKDHKGKKDGKKAMAGQFRGEFNPFVGIQLTPEQEARLENLQKSLRPEREIANKDNLTDDQKKEFKKGKSAQRSEMKRSYLNGVKSILTPEQYVQFLENSYLNQDKGPGKMDKRNNPKRDDKQIRGGKPDKKK